MAVIPAVVTNDAKKYWPQFLGQLLGLPGTPSAQPAVWDPRIKLFRYGEGGWQLSGLVKVPRTPDADLRRGDVPGNVQDIDAICDLTRGVPRYDQNPLSPNYSVGNYQKSLTPADFTFESPSTIRIRCFLDFGEFNEDTPGSGRNPEIWEMAVFSDHPTLAGEYLMVAYGTFPKEDKNGTKQIENVLRLVF